MLPNLVIAVILLVLTFVVARLVQRRLPRVSPSVTLGFAFQDIAANFISGVSIAVQRPFNVGDVIETDKFFGTIERISLRTLDIRQTTGELVIVPNRKVFENPLINLTQQTVRRIDIECGVGYESDLEQVQQVVLAAMRSLPGLVPERKVEVMFTAFADSSITFQLRFWVPFRRQVDYVGARSKAIIRIKRAFDVAGINVPFPIRTLHLHADALAQLAPVLRPAAAPTPPPAAEA